MHIIQFYFFLDRKANRQWEASDGRLACVVPLFSYTCVKIKKRFSEVSHAARKDILKMGIMLEGSVNAYSS